MLRYPTDAQGRLKNPTPSQRISYWLLPEGAQFEVLQSLIDNLAAYNGGPSFEPHVTVYCGPMDPQQSPATLVQQNLEGLGPLVLRSKGLEFTTQFTKSCYIQFDPDEKLQLLCERLRSASGISGDYSLDPHMSLLYGRLDHDARAEIRTSVDIPAQVRLATVWVVLTPALVTRAEDVKKWRLVYVMELDL